MNIDTPVINEHYLEITVDDWAWELMIHIERYIDDIGSQIPYMPKTVCDSIIITSIKSFIKSQNDHSKIADCEDYIIDYIVSQPWFINEVDGIYELIGIIVSYLNCTIISALSNHYLNNQFDLLELILLNDDRYCIKNNGDYRIHEYYRLKNRYEPDTKIGQYLQPPSDLYEKNRKLTKLEIKYYDNLEQEMEFKINQNQLKQTQMFLELIKDPKNVNIVPALLSTIKKAYNRYK